MKLIHELVTEYAAAFPDKPAVQDPAGEFTYGELEARSAALAGRLKAQGFASGDTAVVCVPYGKEILLGAITVLRAGGVFIPVDDGYPLERIQYMLKDSDAAAILTVRELWERKKPDFPEEKVLFLDEPCEETGAGSCETLTEESPAMLLYTSGTTGNPKGVLHIHRMLTHIADWMVSAPMDEATRSGVMSSFSFVGTQMYLLGPLTKGGTVCIAPEAARKDIGYLDQFLHENDITHIFLPSSLAAIMAEDYDISGIHIFAAGEKLRNFRPRESGNVLINSYGSTETSGILSKVIYGNEERIPVGKPCKGTDVLLVDENLTPVEAGTPGEMLISNDFMARQYFGLEELSRKKWVTIDGKTWYRTGDRALLTQEGDYELLGRTDNMVKIRGFRVETGEVEVQVARAMAETGRSDVGQAVVVVKTVGGIQHLCCYYEADEALDEKKIQSEIAKYLAEYMVPDVWIRMDELPRNANGKVMRKELPQPRRKRVAHGMLDSEVVARIVFTVGDILKTGSLISTEDRFTDLGGTSLMAMEFATALREQGISVSGADILRLNQLRKIADAAKVNYEQLWTPEEYEMIRADFAGRGEHIEKVFPISNWQDEMLFEQSLFPDERRYYDSMLLQMDSTVAEEHLREALDVVGKENEELRSAIVFHDVAVIQQVITDRTIPLVMIDSETYDRSNMDDLRELMLYAPMDLQEDCIMRVIGFYKDGFTFLYIRAHHVAVPKGRLRMYLGRMMEILSQYYPEDISIRDWNEIFHMDLPKKDKDESSENRIRSLEIQTEAPPEICVYSQNDGPKMVFVHTANTGSSAYYQLADRIGDIISFAVIEPFNLYHPDEAKYGIRNIAERYVRTLKKYQPEGPYILGGWCYGGVVAHEMACQMEQAGDEVSHLFMLDSHAIGVDGLREMSRSMMSEVNREYFETCPLFADLRESGMLDALISNASHTGEDLMNHVPSVFHGPVTYFKPDQTPAGATGDSLKYWEGMMKYEAGNYENYCDREKLRIVHTPHEHDLMMDDPSLDIIVPEILEQLHL